MEQINKYIRKEMIEALVTLIESEQESMEQYMMPLFSLLKEKTVEEVVEEIMHLYGTQLERKVKDPGPKKPMGRTNGGIIDSIRDTTGDMQDYQDRYRRWLDNLEYSSILTKGDLYPVIIQFLGSVDARKYKRFMEEGIKTDPVTGMLNYPALNQTKEQVQRDFVKMATQVDAKLLGVTQKITNLKKDLMFYTFHHYFEPRVEWNGCLWTVVIDICYDRILHSLTEMEEKLNAIDVELDHIREENIY